MNKVVCRVIKFDRLTRYELESLSNDIQGLLYVSKIINQKHALSLIPYPLIFLLPYHLSSYCLIIFLPYQLDRIIGSYII